MLAFSRAAVLGHSVPKCEGRSDYNMQTTAASKGWLREITGQSIPPHSGIFKLHLQAQATLGTATVRESVKLPRGIDRNEWVASMMFSIMEEVVQLVSLMDGLCTEDTCARMTAGKYTSYSWADEKHPIPCQLSAPEYMRTLVAYAEARMADRSVVPIDGSPFPPEFEEMVRTLCKRFFRVYAHVYLSHFQLIHENGVEAHVNCLFKRFLYFVKEFNLVSAQDMQPLAQLIANFIESDAKKDKELVGQVPGTASRRPPAM